MKNRYARLRQQAITLLGGKCECCSESALDRLHIDHRNGLEGEKRRPGIPIVLAVIGGTKIFRNMLGKIKGVYAVGATILVSIVVGEVMFLEELDWLFAGVGGLFAGLESAAVFSLSKFVGKKVIKVEKV
ncbi:hypothetical protein LCGC14_1719710 [marine sediment metagenome]|uniref:Uncharacterized protein n=1 Tax=marine sediment metagenome TaxID=412755 RepID=A0A0F9HCL8_9ZZZZ